MDQQYRKKSSRTGSLGSDLKALQLLHINAEANEPMDSTSESNILEERSLSSLGYKHNKWPKGDHQHLMVDKPKLYDILGELLKKRLKNNAIVTIGTFSTPVHLTVLQCFSRLFRDLGNEVLVDLPSTLVTPRAFLLIYDWMLADDAQLPRLGLVEVMRAANFLEVPQLIKQCEHCINNYLKEDAAVMLYLEARMLRIDRSYYNIFLHVGKFFLTLVASLDFLQLPREPLGMLLKSNNICVNSELEVLMAAVRWLNFQWPQRRGSIGELVAYVRFALIPPWLLVKIQKTDVSSIELKRITADSTVRQRIHDGIAYTTTRLFYGNDREAFALHLKKTNTTPPVQRVWIYDQRCSYHHRMHCRAHVEFTFQVFVEYLNFLQTQNKDYWQCFESAETGTCHCKKRAIEDVEIF
ncbi:kelch-like protein 26 [Scaptodrosophila lebanonensis]|uniref:Kelch-like protein 26 n=1 Tax=Drosophila lebanonensis TaxID=7225 RepID=A0A6J2SYT5_DROLE|nr:kelch-like protein 26 [Scaptodrosophila lebanonensis]